MNQLEKQTVTIKVCDEKNAYNEVQYRNINCALKRKRRNNMLSPYKKLKQYQLIKLRIQKKGQLFLHQKKQDKRSRRGLKKEIQEAKFEQEFVHITLDSNSSSISIQEPPKSRLQNYAQNSDDGCEKSDCDENSLQQIFIELQYQYHSQQQEEIQFYQSQSNLYVENQDNLIDSWFEYMSQGESLEEQFEVDDKPKKKNKTEEKNCPKCAFRSLRNY